MKNKVLCALLYKVIVNIIFIYHIYTVCVCERRLFYIGFYMCVVASHMCTVLKTSFRWIWGSDNVVLCWLVCMDFCTKFGKKPWLAKRG